MQDDDPLAQKLLTILPHLNEKQRRLVLAAEARSLGYSGVSTKQFLQQELPVISVDTKKTYCDDCHPLPANN